MVYYIETKCLNDPEILCSDVYVCRDFRYYKYYDAIRGGIALRYSSVVTEMTPLLDIYNILIDDISNIHHIQYIQYSINAVFISHRISKRGRIHINLLNDHINLKAITGQYNVKETMKIPYQDYTPEAYRKYFNIMSEILL